MPSARPRPPPFPGQLIRRGRPAPRAVVRALQRRLLARGYGPLGVTGLFDAQTLSVLRLYQAQHVDATGRPLQVDGVVGPITWASLFGAAPARRGPRPSRLAQRALAVAVAQLGVLEHPPGSNHGPEVDRFLLSVGIGPETPAPGDRAWCQAFVYWCYQEAARQLGVANPLFRTAGVLRHWRAAQASDRARCFTRDELLADLALVQPGMLLVLDYGKGLGHIGFVAHGANGRLLTVEGNINAEADPGREGVGVFWTDRRTLADARVRGMIRYH